MSGTAENTLGLEKSSTELVQAATVVKNVLSTVSSLEKVAPATGAVGVVIGVAAAIVKLAMGNVDSEELTYMKKQFQVVRNQLDVISDQIKQVLWEIERSTVNNQYFIIEENLKNQFRKYMNILNAAPEFREKQKQEFLTHFNETKGDQNLHTLFDGVMGKSDIFGKPILETAMGYDQRNRRLMEGLCSRLKELLCIGLIALMGHAALAGNDVEALKREWNEKMAKVESKMKSMIDRCINEFAEQAEIDVKKLIQGKGGRDNKECASYIRDSLVEKYDWVTWSVRVYKPVMRLDSQYIMGSNQFRHYNLNNINVVVSYAIDPKPIDAEHIRQLLWDNRISLNAVKIGEYVSNNLPSNYVVHVVRGIRNLAGSHNIPASCYFEDGYPGVTLCVHST